MFRACGPPPDPKRLRPFGPVNSNVIFTKRKLPVTSKGIIRAIIIAGFLSLPTVLLYSFVPRFSEPLNVPNMAVEDFRVLSDLEQREFLLSTKGLRQVSRLEKATYLIQAEPTVYLSRLLVLFTMLFVAAFLGSRFSEKSRWRNITNR